MAARVRDGSAAVFALPSFVVVRGKILNANYRSILIRKPLPVEYVCAPHRGFVTVQVNMNYIFAKGTVSRPAVAGQTTLWVFARVPITGMTQTNVVLSCAGAGRTSPLFCVSMVV